MFSLKICYVSITHYHAIAIVLFSCVSVVQERCNNNVLISRYFVEIVANRKVFIYLKINNEKSIKNAFECILLTGSTAPLAPLGSGTPGYQCTQWFVNLGFDVMHRFAALASRLND